MARAPLVSFPPLAHPKSLTGMRATAALHQSLILIVDDDVVKLVNIQNVPRDWVAINKGSYISPSLSSPMEVEYKISKLVFDVCRQWDFPTRLTASPISNPQTDPDRNIHSPVQIRDGANAEVLHGHRHPQQ